MKPATAVSTNIIETSTTPISVPVSRMQQHLFKTLNNDSSEIRVRSQMDQIQKRSITNESNGSLQVKSHNNFQSHNKSDNRNILLVRQSLQNPENSRTLNDLRGSRNTNGLQSKTQTSDRQIKTLPNGIIVSEETIQLPPTQATSAMDHCRPQRLQYSNEPSCQSKRRSFFNSNNPQTSSWMSTSRRQTVFVAKPYNSVTLIDSILNEREQQQNSGKIVDNSKPQVIVPIVVEETSITHCLNAPQNKQCHTRFKQDHSQSIESMNRFNPNDYREKPNTELMSAFLKRQQEKSMNTVVKKAEALVRLNQGNINLFEQGNEKGVGLSRNQNQTYSFSTVQNCNPYAKISFKDHYQTNACPNQTENSRIDQETKSSSSLSKRHVLGNPEDYLQTLKVKQLEDMEKQKSIFKPTLLQRLTTFSQQQNNNQQQIRKDYRETPDFIPKTQGLVKSTSGNLLSNRSLLEEKNKQEEQRKNPVLNQVDNDIARVESRVHINSILEHESVSAKSLSKKLEETRFIRASSSYQRTSQHWDKLSNLAQRKLQKHSSVMTRSEQFRSKQELADLLDRGLSLREKYGGDRGWKLQLRFDENIKGDVLEWREQAGGQFSGISTQEKDDRWKPVEIIRKSVLSSHQGQYQSDYDISRMSQPEQNRTKVTQGQRKQSVIETGQDSQHFDDGCVVCDSPRYSETNVSQQTSLAKHPLVKQRYQGKESKLNDILPTQSDDSVLASLSVIGQNVLQLEKEAYRRQAEQFIEDQKKHQLKHTLQSNPLFMGAFRNRIVNAMSDKLGAMFQSQKNYHPVKKLVLSKTNKDELEMKSEGDTTREENQVEEL